MGLRFLTVTKYELKQYTKSYFEQFFILSSMALIFLMVSGASEGVTLDTPSSYGIYRVGYLAGGELENYTHYSLRMTGYGGRDAGMAALAAGDIDVYADESPDGFVSFKTADSARSQAALKRLRQLILGEKRDRIYSLADSNASLDGILLPIKVRVEEHPVDYTNAIDPSVYLHRGRFLDRDSMDNGEISSKANILDYESVRRMNLSELLAANESASALDAADKSGFTLPEEWEIPFVFRSLYNNMAVVSVSILISILLTLSFAKEKVNKTLLVLFQTPASKLDILVGKSLPYFLVIALVNLAYSLSVSGGWDAVKIFYIFTVLSATLLSFALFTVLASKNYREVTFMGSLSLLSFLMFIVLPNIFSGINLLAFVSPLDTVTSIQNQAQVGALDVFMSLLPYKFLFLFFFTATLVCFDPETLQNTPDLTGLMRTFYVNLSRSLGGGVKYAVAGVALLVPFVYITQTLTAYLILPFGLLAPYASILLLAAVEELTKILPYYYSRRISPALYGLVAGATFFVTEKVFNIYLISKVYSYLPAPYTVFVAKGFTYTLILHIVTATLLAYIVSRSRGRRHILAGLVLASLIHYWYNMEMIGWGLMR
jgi:hypothetical protein